MSLFSSGDRVLSWSLSCCFLVFLLGGCNTAPEKIEPLDYQDDFGTSFAAEPITAESVAEESMLHQRAQFDLKFDGAIPTESKIDPAFSIGGKVGLEVFKNLFMGLSFNYANHEINDGADDSLTGDIGRLDAIQLFQEYDRFSILGHFDYDIPLTKPSADFGALTFRFGLGVGLVIIDGEEDPFLRSQFEQARSSFELVTFYTAVVRPSLELRCRVWEHGHVFAGVSYDWVPGDRIDARIGGERAEVDSDIDFDNVNIGAGFSFEW